MSILQYSRIEKAKNMNRVARRGPLARAPGALKGDTSEIVNIFVAVEGGTLWREKNRKKSHNAEKLKGGTSGVFQNPFCRKTSKN